MSKTLKPSGLIARDFHPDRCLNAKYPPADCRVCREICPVEAIHFDGANPTLSKNCLGCGLCVSACPREALGDPFRTLVGDDNPATGYFCSGLWANEPAGQPNLPEEAIPCLGSVSLGTLVERLLGQTTAIRIVTGHCSTCPLAKGRQQFDRHMERLEAIAGILGLASKVASVEPATESDLAGIQDIKRDYIKKRTDQASMSRRDLFSGFRRVLAPRPQPKISAPPAGQSDGAAEEAEDERPDARVRIQQFLHLHRSELSPETILPFFRKVQVSEACNLCGVCARLCPAAAIYSKRDSERAELWVDSARCTECGLCETKCPRSAIHYSAGLAIGEAIAGSTLILSKEVRRCLDCRKEFLVQGDETYCPSCNRVARVREDVSNIIFGEE